MHLVLLGTLVLAVACLLGCDNSDSPSDASRAGGELHVTLSATGTGNDIVGLQAHLAFDPEDLTFTCPSSNCVVDPCDVEVRPPLAPVALCQVGQSDGLVIVAVVRDLGDPFTAPAPDVLVLRFSWERREPTADAFEVLRCTAVDSESHRVPDVSCEVSAVELL